MLAIVEAMQEMAVAVAVAIDSTTAGIGLDTTLQLVIASL